MILSIPHNRICSNRSTRYPITNYDPVLWIRTDNATNTVINIDGFIVTNTKKVNGILKKFEYLKESPNDTFSIEIINTIFPKNEIKLISNFSEIMDCGFYTFIWPNNFPTNYDENSKLIYLFTLDFIADKPRIKNHKLISLEELENGIKKLRGRSFSNPKKLNSSSSNVECYLANNTSNPWPGDIDSIIYDWEKRKFVAIVEFKTHNIDTAIEQEHIGKYGNEDWRRFNVLFELIDNFQEKLGYKPKLLFVVWGTNTISKNHANLKIDLIERNRTLKSFTFPRPIFNHYSKELFEFLKAI